MKKLLFLVLLLLPTVVASSGQMKLLAVSETEFGYIGSTADLYLEIRPGRGRVFIDSFPLSKLDTQISTRFAKEIACDFLEKNCENMDFFYTIRSGTTVVGGPSAGAAITILTISVLDGLKMDKNVAITGTINSGGIIGPVGGTEAKIEAAAELNMTKVLVPKWSALNETNLTGIEIIRVSDLETALFEFTGKDYGITEEFSPSESYLETMRNISDRLCQRSLRLNTSYENDSVQTEGWALLEQGMKSMDEGKYYSAASYCFGANVKFNYLRMKNSDLTFLAIAKKIVEIQNLTREFRNYINAKPIETITDLQTFLIVNERLNTADEYMLTTQKTINDTDLSLNNLAFGIERLNSAYLWEDFFGTEGMKFTINDDTIRTSCLNKISEVEERSEYLKLYLGFVPGSVQSAIDEAHDENRKGNYRQCLYQASKTKADINIFLNNLVIQKEFLDEVIEDRLVQASKVISRLDKKGIFPIIGYSYFEYANSLKETDKFSAMLYTEYAMELSKMDMYFPKPSIRLPMIEAKDIWLLLLGISIGLMFGVLLFRKPSKHLPKETLPGKKR